MRIEFNHEINNDPEPEHAGTITVTATIFGDDDNFNPPFTTTSLPIKDIFEYESQCREELVYFLEPEFDVDVIADAMLKLLVYVDDVTCSTRTSEYSPEFALEVQLDFLPDYLDDDNTQLQIEEALQVSFDDDDTQLHIEEALQVSFDDDDTLPLIEEALQVSFDDDDTQPQIEEALQVSFDETSNNTLIRPASKLVVKSLTRKVYNKKIKKEKRNKKEIYKKISLEECTICLQEFCNGGTVVTLPCGHDFDDECIVKWFETSHVCPLCRFKLPCQD